MATIPDSRALGARVIPQSGRRISTDQSGEIVASAVGQFGQALGAYQAKVDHFNYGKAKSDLLAADMAVRRELEDDPDFGTYEPRYRERMKVEREKAAKIIVNRGDRSLFDQDSSFAIERGAAAMHDISKSKEGDAGRADLEARLATNRTGALQAADQDTRADFVTSSNDLIDGSVANGYITREAGGETKRVWTSKYGEGWAVMLPPEERVKVLAHPRGTPAEFIDPEVATLMLRAAQNEDKESQVRGLSQGYAAEIWKQGGSLAEMRRKARTIEDPAAQDATVVRLEGFVADQEADRNRYQNNAADRVWQIYASGNTSWDDVPTADANALDPKLGIAIKAAFNDRAAGRDIQTDVEFKSDLKDLAAKDPRKYLEVAQLGSIRPYLNDKDYETERATRTELERDLAGGYSILTEVQMVEKALEPEGGDVDKKDKIRLTIAFDSALEAAFKATGKKPTVEEKRVILSNLVKDAAVEGWLWGSNEKPFYELTDEDVEHIVIPAADRTALQISLTRKLGRAPTEAEIKRTYMLGTRGF